MIRPMTVRAIAALAALGIALSGCGSSDKDSTTVRGHSQAVGAKGGLIRRLLVDHAVALRRKSTPAQTVRDALSASSWRVAKRRITVPFQTC